MKREPPIPTVVETRHKGKSRSTVRWKVCWSDGSRSSLDYTSLEIACEWAAWEYLSRLLWVEETEEMGGVYPTEPWRH
jgi:hypothetical protein